MGKEQFPTKGRGKNPKGLATQKGKGRMLSLGEGGKKSLGTQDRHNAASSIEKKGATRFSKKGGLSPQPPGADSRKSREEVVHVFQRRVKKEK